jgi:hypothetical protein
MNRSWYCRDKSVLAPVDNSSPFLGARSVGLRHTLWAIRLPFWYTLLGKSAYISSIYCHMYPRNIVSDGGFSLNRPWSTAADESSLGSYETKACRCGTRPDRRCISRHAHDAARLATTPERTHHVWTPRSHGEEGSCIHALLSDVWHVYSYDTDVRPRWYALTSAGASNLTREMSKP